MQRTQHASSKQWNQQRKIKHKKKLNISAYKLELLLFYSNNGYNLIITKKFLLFFYSTINQPQTQRVFVFHILETVVVRDETKSKTKLRFHFNLAYCTNSWIMKQTKREGENNWKIKSVHYLIIMELAADWLLLIETLSSIGRAIKLSTCGRGLRCTQSTWRRISINILGHRHSICAFK